MNKDLLLNYHPAFQAAMLWLGPIEGGYVNDPDDPGGETQFGISKRAYPNLDIANLTQAQAVRIYHRDYWKAAYCHELPDALAIAVFDAAVNHGVSVAKLMLQNALKVKPDGKIGPITLAAARQTDTALLVSAYLLRRGRRYARIVAKRQRSQKYLEGWFNRLDLLLPVTWQYL
ncbi:N-acetylmuramidase [Motilimonas cestriensis]|uniref:N-acetylmuramidase n=1 Tax=Motilimonas cestriensis TaxID=2742685 RepID=A0ABS8W9E8_9GAMM|nr:N-acetylmuramidase [Motilimonas cestriensis]MCE2594424.1 N-acetylmuramidase [Motilimonas cestriensis]